VNVWYIVLVLPVFILLCRLIDSVDHGMATKIIRDQQASVLATLQHSPHLSHNIDSAEQRSLEQEKVAACNGAIAFLDYITTNYMEINFWASWSQKGRTVASLLLNIPVEGVLPTTNHLEAFHSILKNKYIAQYKRSGRRLRFDSFIHILISHILPDIFSLRHTSTQYRQWLAMRFRSSAGGVDLVALRAEMTAGTDAPIKAVTAGLLWWERDDKKDRDAYLMALAGRIVISASPDSNEYLAICASASANILDPNHLRYTLSLRRDGAGTCSCPHFQNQGGACKHLRLMKMYIDQWVNTGKIRPFHYPQSPAGAIQLSVSEPSGNDDFISEPAVFSTLSGLNALNEVISMCGVQDDEDDDDDDEGNVLQSPEDDVTPTDTVSVSYLSYFIRSDTHALLFRFLTLVTTSIFRSIRNPLSHLMKVLTNNISVYSNTKSNPCYLNCMLFIACFLKNSLFHRPAM
jgi:hypothetical protein